MSRPPGNVPALAAAPQPPAESEQRALVFTESEGELPDAYGTARLFLTPRDPRCLCAQWDLAPEQLRYFNACAAGKHLVLRLYYGQLAGERAAELHVHPDSRHWFAQVDRPGAAYAAELGYYTPEGEWRTVTTSEPVATPPEAPAARQEPARFARFEFEPAQQPAAQPEHVAPPQGSASSTAQPQPSAPPTVAKSAPTVVSGPPPRTVPSVTYVPSPPPLLATGAPETADQVECSLGDSHDSHVLWADPELLAEGPLWTPAQEEALAELINLSLATQDWPGSAEIAQLLSRGRPRAISSAEAAQPELPHAQPGASIASPPGFPTEAITSPAPAQPTPGKGFWFNVNAELIIYGATEPDAQVTIGHRTIRLRPDGCFSYRFALPDGDYYLPITATASHGEQRRCELEFYRGTRYEGDIGAHPQDPGLEAPTVDNLT